MHREVFALLYNDNKDAPPLLSTDTGAGYIQVKARLGMKKVRKWEWSPFTNPARSDKAVFHHWRRATDDPREYPFAKFNKVLSIPAYTPNEYTQHLKTNQVKWSKAQTDHLFELAKRFDMRFVIMADRWDRANYGTKTVEDLKERYYEVLNLLQKATVTPNAPLEKKPFVFDAEHERKRKEQLRKLFDRSSKQIEEEQMLLNELKKIDARKKERDRKTQDLQKLISQADQVCQPDACFQVFLNISISNRFCWSIARRNAADAKHHAQTGQEVEQEEDPEPSASVARRFGSERKCCECRHFVNVEFTAYRNVYHCTLGG